MAAQSRKTWVAEPGSYDQGGPIQVGTFDLRVSALRVETLEGLTNNEKVRVRFRRKQFGPIASYCGHRRVDI